jgi:hypothetical protein
MAAQQTTDIKFVNKPASDFKQNPNLGDGCVVASKASDDAVNAFFLPVNYIKFGCISMPFLHILFLQKFFEGRCEITSRYLSIIADLTRLRQLALIRKINEVLVSKGAKPHPITKEQIELEKNKDAIIETALKIGISIDRYMNVDQDDIDQSTNDWNLKQNESAGSAADFILVIQDVDGEYFVAVIERAFGPGRGEAAWPGGFVDKVDLFMEQFNSSLTFANAAERENSEETSHTLLANSSVSVTSEEGVFPVFISPFTEGMKLEDGQIGEIGHWDVRGKFINGMKNGGKWRFVKYSQK